MTESVGRITGVADYGISFESGKRAIELAARAAIKAVEDAGLTLGDIDGMSVSKGGDLLPADRPGVELADYLGLTLTYTDTTLAGGVSPMAQIGHALDAIAQGRCRRVLVVYGSHQGTARSQGAAGSRKFGGWQDHNDHHVAPFERSTGLPIPIGTGALAAARHSWEFGTTRAQYTAVAANARAWGALNPDALVRSPLTDREIADSPLLSDPIRKIDCCLISDGAGAVVVEGPQARRGVRVRGFAELHQHFSVLSARSLTSTGAAVTGPEAMRQAGVKHADVGLLQLYDAFTVVPIILFEDLGFAEKGRGGRHFEDGHASPGGSLPTNTQGGGLAHCHPGYYGIFLVIEAVRQLRGSAGERQVSDPRVALCQGAGGGGLGGSQVSIVLDGSSS